MRCTAMVACLGRKKERKEIKNEKKVVRLSRVTNWNLENVKFSGTKIKVISSYNYFFWLAVLLKRQSFVILTSI
jgi:hypothetical protein